MPLSFLPRLVGHPSGTVRSVPLLNDFFGSDYQLDAFKKDIIIGVDLAIDASARKVSRKP